MEEEVRNGVNLGFKRFKGLVKKILKEIHYEIEIKTLTSIIDNYQEILEQLARAFVQDHPPAKDQKPEPSKAESLHCSQVSSAASDNKINDKKTENEQMSSCTSLEPINLLNYSFINLPVPMFGIQENGMVIMGNAYMDNSWMNQGMGQLYCQNNLFWQP